MFRWQVAIVVIGSIVASAMNVSNGLADSGDGGVKVVANEGARRVDVTVDGQPFTSYIWPDTIKKPVLYPLRTAMGTPITRGYPLEPRAGERTDHPHQVGLWLNYGDVNGYDFWNNSEAIKPEERGHYGTTRPISGA